MPDTKNNFSVGNYIVDFENIYRITDQQDQKDQLGKTVLYYFFELINVTDSKILSSIPATNIIKSGFRPLISKDVVTKLYKEAEEKIDHEIVLDFKSIKEILYENNPLTSLGILKQLFLEREVSPQKFIGANKEILKSVLRHICDEISLVTKEPTPKVQEKLTLLILKAIK